MHKIKNAASELIWTHFVSLETCHKLFYLPISENISNLSITTLSLFYSIFNWYMYVISKIWSNKNIFIEKYFFR